MELRGPYGHTDLEAPAGGPGSYTWKVIECGHFACGSLYSVSSRVVEAEIDRVFLVEEVPGVPENERWFASGGPLTPPYPHFATQAEGEQWLCEQGLPDFTVEYFGP